MQQQTLAGLLDELQAERQRRQELERSLAQLTRSRALAPITWLHRLTGRGPDLRAIDSMIETGGSPVIADPTDLDTSRMVVDEFHRLYYEHPERTWMNTRWFGTQVQKLPLDLWLYQEIVFRNKPDLIIETGTMMGGSALFLAHLFDIVGNGEVMTIDLVDRANRPVHPRIEYVSGSSTDGEIVARAADRAGGRKTMVILDSDHSQRHVAAELAAYAPLVSPGMHLIVEDTNVYGHPVNIDHGPGPAEALAAFQSTNDQFEVDPKADKYYFTFNPGGVLIRKPAAGAPQG